MGETFIKLEGKELSRVTIHCPYCGIGLQIDLSKPIGDQLKEQVCTCGKPLTKHFKEIISSYKAAWDIINDCKFAVNFDIRVER